MVTIKDGCGCDPCDCDWKQKLKEAYARASVSINKVGDFDGSVYFPDGTGFVKLPIPKLSDVQQITQNTQDITDLKNADVQLQANITAEENARIESITTEQNARIASITAEENARIESITTEQNARIASITAEETARKAKDNDLDSDITRINATDARQTELIQDNADRINSTYNDLVATEATVATHNTEIINLQSQTQALSKSLVSDVMMTDGTTAGSVQVSIEKEDGALITSANYRWGKDIGIRLEAGTQEGYVKAVISLSDGTELVSNEYKIVEVLESDVYVTAITLIADQAAGTLGGNISYSNGTTQTINSVSVPTAPGVTSAIEALQSRMTAVEQKNTTQDSQISAIDARVKAIEDTPGVGQFAAGKLGTIAGSTTDGRIKAEDDGTGSVNGWSTLKQRVTTAEGQIVTAQNDITDLDGMIAGKVDITQGAANAGKALVIGSDGNVAPGVVSGGEIWEEVDLNNWPTDWVEGDRIKIKFKGVYPNISNVPSAWTTEFTGTVSIEVLSSSTSPIIEVELPSSNYDMYYPIREIHDGYIQGFIKFYRLYQTSRWNSSSYLFSLQAYAYNGGGYKQSNELDIYPSSISTYVEKMWRLKR